MTFVYGEKNLPKNVGRTWPDSPDLDELHNHDINTEIVTNSGHFMMIDNFEGYVDCILNGLTFEK